MAYSPKAEKKRIRKIAKDWQDVLALYEWEITTEYVDGPLLVDGALNRDAAGCAKVNWQYRSATISFNTQETAKMSDVELEGCYVHEAMHVLIREMREPDDDLKHEERTASTLAWAFLRARGVR